MSEVMRWHYKRKDGHVVGHVIRLEDENELGSPKSRNGSYRTLRKMVNAVFRTI